MIAVPSSHWTVSVSATLQRTTGETIGFSVAEARVTTRIRSSRSPTSSTSRIGRMYRP